MSGKAIAADIAGALDEAATAVGKRRFRVTFIRAGEAVGDPWNPTPGEPTRHDLRAMRGKYMTNEIDGTLIQRGDIKLMVEAGAFIPSTADTAEMSGKTYAVINVEFVSPGGEALIYKVQVRK